MSVYKRYNYTLTVNGKHTVDFVSYYDYNNPIETEEVKITARQVASGRNLVGIMTVKPKA